MRHRANAKVWGPYLRKPSTPRRWVSYSLAARSRSEVKRLKIQRFHQAQGWNPMSEDLFSVLPLELQVYIADAVGERCDRAALALVSPRLLGLAACRGLPSYQGLEMSLAFHVVLGGAIDEQVLRRYASRAEATLEGCGWLTGVAAASRATRAWRCHSPSTTCLGVRSTSRCFGGTPATPRRRSEAADG